MLASDPLWEYGMFLNVGEFEKSAGLMVKTGPYSSCCCCPPAESGSGEYGVRYDELLVAGDG